MISSERRHFSGAKAGFAAAVAATVLFAAAARAQDDAPANPSVTVDLSVIEDQGSGSTRPSLARPGGLIMPRPDVFPQSQLYEPDPDSLPYATLNPPRQRTANLRPPGSKRQSPRLRALELTDLTPAPRPQETSPRPQGAATSIGQEPRAVTAPSRTGAVVGPTPSRPQILGPDDTGPARLGPRPRPAADVAAIAPTATGAASAPEAEHELSTPPALPPGEETASTPPLSQELTGASGSAAAIEPPSAPATKQAVTTPLPQADEKSVALQPAARMEQGSLPPSEGTQATGDLLQVEFGATDTSLTSSSRAELKDLADRLRSQENLRLQLLAYADGENLSPSKARRMSLSRALSVRSYLIENGIKTSRIDVRALGDKAPSAPMDRVDVKVVQR